MTQDTFNLRLQTWKGWHFLAFLLGGIMLLLIYVPLASLAVLSFSENPLSGNPFPLSVENYRQLGNDAGWRAPLWASVMLSLVVALFCMVVGAAVGRGITRLRKPGLPLLITMLPLFVPGLTMGAALFILLNTVAGLPLGFWSIFIAQLLWALPFAILLVAIIASRLDLRLLEAAEDLGAPPWRRFIDIELPLLMPGISGAGIFGFLLSFNELMRSLFVRGLQVTMPIYNWLMASAQQSQVPIIFSLSTLVMIIAFPVVGAFFLYMFRKR